MVPVLLLALVAVVLVVAVLGVATGRVRADPLADAVHTTPDAGLPPEPSASDVDTVRFDTALRGYRMDEVDARLEQLREALAQREQTLGELPDVAAPDAGGTDPTTVPPTTSSADLPTPAATERPEA